MKTILISGCLIGLSCDYKARKKEITKEISKLMDSDEYILIPFCPEQLGGMATPRYPSEIINGTGIDVIEKRAIMKNNQGELVTNNFLKGAEEALYLCNKYSAEFVILKERSPSCGVKSNYDGTFSGKLIEGSGVTTALLTKHGYKVISEEEYKFLK